MLKFFCLLFVCSCIALGIMYSHHQKKIVMLKKDISICSAKLKEEQRDSGRYFVDACSNYSLYQITMRKLCKVNRKAAVALLTELNKSRFKNPYIGETNACDIFDRWDREKQERKKLRGIK